MYEKRISLVKQKLEEKVFDAFITKQEGNIRYLCCSPLPFPVVTYLIITKKDLPIGIVASLEELRARDECYVKELYSFSDYPGVKASGKNAEEVLKKILSTKKVRSALADSKVKVKGVVIKKDNFVSKLRARKDERELGNIARACRIASKCAKALDNLIKEGMSELEIANELDYYLRNLGAQGTSFPTIIASGKHSSYSHHYPTNKKIKLDESIICDFGALYKGYCSDLTRTLLPWDPKKELLFVYELVKDAQESAIKMIKPGIKFGDLDLSIRNFFKEHNYDKYFVHSTGHGIGLEVHEAPRITCVNKNKIEVGNVFTLEPGLYIPKKFGIRIEDIIAMTKQGAKILTR